MIGWRWLWNTFLGFELIKNGELFRQRQAIDALINRTRAACADDLELQSHWAKYICVICFGFLCNSVIEIYSDFIKVGTNPKVGAYASSTLRQIQSINSEKLLKVVEKFDPSWSDNLEAHLGSERKDAIDSIANNRHQIAHGKNIGLTLTALQGYWAKALEVVEFLEDQCQP